MTKTADYTLETAALMSDCYKFGHRELYPTGTTMVYSTLTPRANSYYKRTDKMVAFGYQLFAMRNLKEGWDNSFFNQPWEAVEKAYTEVVCAALGEVSGEKLDNLKELYGLGYLPISVKALPEGSLVPMKVPVLTIENTHPDFAWLVGFLETTLLNETYAMSTVATKALEFKKLGEKFASKTCDNNFHLPYQFHDFSMRGQHGTEAALRSGLSHLTSFVGSDTLPASILAHNYYNAEYGSNLLQSVKATEHSVMQAYGKNEIQTILSLIEKVPTGILSVVCDTYDYWGMLSNVLPVKEVYKAITEREGKFVVRPDSGDPYEVLLGKKVEARDVTDTYDWSNLTEQEIARELFDYATEDFRDDEKYSGAHGEIGMDAAEFKYVVNNMVYTIKVEAEYNRYDKQYYYVDSLDAKLVNVEPFFLDFEEQGTLKLLWDTFGGTVNEKGFKVLSDKVGVLFGEGITEEVAEKILTGMAKHGWASSNVVFGVGAYVYSVDVTRDSFGQAVKTTAVEIDGEFIPVFKDPKTDPNGLKKSAKGFVAVTEQNGELVLQDNLTPNDKIEGNLLRPIFTDGKLFNLEDFNVIKERVASHVGA